MKIELSNSNKTVLVDDGSEFLLDYTWSLRTDGYACTWQGRYCLLMHRLIMGLKKNNPMQVDHKNRNRSDNRKCNLRIVTSSQQRQNTSSQINKSSKYRGVCWDKERQKWKAQVKVNGKPILLGRFDEEDEAARVASDFRKQVFPFAVEGGRPVGS